MNTLAERGAATRNKVADKVAGVDAIEIKITIPDAQVEPALSRYGLTVDNDERRDRRTGGRSCFLPSPSYTLRHGKTPSTGVRWRAVSRHGSG